MKRLTILLFLLTFTMISSAQEEVMTLDLLFVGDIMGHGPQIKSAYDATTKSYDYNPCFKYVKPIIEQADLAIGNLEVTLSDKGRYTGYPLFRSPDALADALKNAGFDLLVTSNNHSNDNGAYGVTHTLDVLDKMGFYHTGTFRNQTERELLYPLIAYKNDFRIAFLNYTYGTNGMPTVAPTVVNEIDESIIKADIEMAEKLKPDAIIVIMHWGLEYQLNESTEQYNLAKNMFEWGANLIIGAHPHVIQPIKKIPFINKDGEAQEGLCVFSMGNFISNQKKYNTDGGLMVEIQLSKTKNAKKATIDDCHYIPVWRYQNRVNEKNPLGTYYTLPIAAFENENIDDLTITKYEKQQMINFVTRMRKHLSKHSGKEKPITFKDLTSFSPSTKVGYISSRNPKAVFASYQTINRDSLIVPVDGERYIIHHTDTEQKSNKTESTIDIPKLPVGSTDKSGDSNRFPPINKNGNQTVVSIKSPVGKIPKIPIKSIAKPDTTSVLDSEKDKYLVQIQTTKSLYSGSLPFEDVIVQEVNGLFRYFLTAGNTLPNARSVLTQVREYGFLDAFIVPNNLEEQTKSISENTEKSVDAVVYKIQFQSSMNLGVPENLPFDDYEVVESDTGWFRYFAGKADSISEAVKVLKELQAAGYKDAFIVQFVNGQPKS